MTNEEAFNSSTKGFRVTTNDGVVIWKQVDDSNRFIKNEYVNENGTLVSCDDYESNSLSLMTGDGRDSACVWSDIHNANVWVPLVPIAA